MNEWLQKGEWFLLWMEVCVMIKFLVIILIKDKKLIKSDDLGDFLTE